ncbi:hypothetical protein HYALB_00008367 [Hymenoscyphus albidus]|uniref:Ankyrin n=1 Tax=Hymenoscyphus albidus TaxID=595503 RepID=A0A9N9LS17_9HELO|nr:hypothetical protein HYALB_00008367 [Hymenoscyphus albidus]
MNRSERRSGTDFNAPRGKTPLQAATYTKQPSLETIELLLAEGADVNPPSSSQYGLTALQGAASYGYKRGALMLLERSADSNASGSRFHGRTALEGVGKSGPLDMVQLLLNAGVEP